MKLSVIIVNWNTAELLAECLNSICAHPPEIAFEVLIVDNASNDGSVQMLLERFPLVRLIKNNVNVGFARANNQAIHQSTGCYVLLLNPDTEVKPGALHTLIEFMDENRETGAAGPRLLNPDGTLQASCYPAPTLFREMWRLFHLDKIFPYGIYDMSTWPLETPRPIDVLQGACLILRREVFDQIGLLDEDYFMYSEEVDLCHRIGKAGWNLFWVPTAEVVHFGGQSTSQIAGEMFLHLYRSKVLYFRKHHGQIATWVYKFILFAASLARLILAPIALLEGAPERYTHLSLSQYYRRLILALPRL